MTFDVRLLYIINNYADAQKISTWEVINVLSVKVSTACELVKFFDWFLAFENIKLWNSDSVCVRASSLNFNYLATAAAGWL